MERRISMTRWMTVSMIPPYSPEIPPRNTPRTRLRATPTSPMDSEVRVPYMSRDQRSRPCSSVPMRNSDSSGVVPSTPKRWRFMGISSKRVYSNPRTKNLTGIFLLGSGVYTRLKVMGSRTPVRP